MNKEKYLENKLKEFGKKLRIKLPLEVKSDKRLRNYMASITEYRYINNNELFYLMKYNPKQIRKATKATIIHCILHELGHIKLGHVNLPEKELTNEIIMECEYEAEKFALKNIKKYEPQYYKQSLKNIIDIKENINHSKAYQRLLEEING